MKFSKRYLIILWIVALIPVIITAIVYTHLPAEIPGHWGFNGSVRYDPKYTIWFTTGLAPLFAFLMPFLAKIDPRKQNYEKFASTYQAFIVVLIAFLALLNGIVIHQSFFPNTISVYMVVLCSVGLLFIFIGNFMPKIKSNFFIGIRTPWTINDIDIWNKTNRLGGQLFFVGGIIMLVTPFVVSEKIASLVVLAVTMLCALPPVVMSYIWYKKKEKENKMN